MPVKITMKGPLVTGQSLLIRQAMIRAAEQIGNVVKMTAIAAYLDKRKTDKLPSMIIDSFSYDMPFTSQTEVRGVIFTGGAKAPYAVFVDKGHRLRSGVWWPGYEFMREGAEAGRKIAEKFVIDELKKVL